MFSGTTFPAGRRRCQTAAQDISGAGMSFPGPEKLMHEAEKLEGAGAATGSRCRMNMGALFRSGRILQVRKGGREI